MSAGVHAGIKGRVRLAHGMAALAQFVQSTSSRPRDANGAECRRERRRSLGRLKAAWLAAERERGCADSFAVFNSRFAIRDSQFSLSFHLFEFAGSFHED